MIVSCLSVATCVTKTPGPTCTVLPESATATARASVAQGSGEVHGLTSSPPFALDATNQSSDSACAGSSTTATGAATSMTSTANTDRRLPRVATQTPALNPSD